MTTMTLNSMVMLLCFAQVSSVDLDANMLASSLDMEMRQACSMTGSCAVELVQRRALEKHSDKLLAGDTDKVKKVITHSAIFSELAPKLPAEALVALGAMFSLNSTSKSSALGTWYCVAQKSKKKVTGPFTDLASAKVELNKADGSSSNRQMICEMTALGPKEDPHKLGDPEENQGGGTDSGFNKWWADYSEIDEMNNMCDGDSVCKAGPPWFCVPRINGIDGKSEVLGPFGDIESAKYELNKTKGSSSNPQMVCEMTKSGATADPHTVGGQSQGLGTKAGFNKWWNSWAMIHQMRGMCNSEPACRYADPHYDENEVLKMLDALIAEERKDHEGEQPIIDAKLNDFSKCTGMPENDTVAEKKAKDAKTASETAIDAAKNQSTASLSLDFGDSETSASIEKAGKSKDIESFHDAYTAALAAAATALTTANQARESADDAHRLKKESKNMCFCNVKESYDTEVTNMKDRTSAREKKILLLERVKCAIAISKGSSDLYSKAFEVCSKETVASGLTDLDYKAKVASGNMPTGSKCNYDNVWFCVSRLSKEVVKGPFIDVEEAQKYINKKGPGNAANYQMICEMSKSGAKYDPAWVGGKHQNGRAGTGFPGTYWTRWDQIHEMNKMCVEDDDCKKGYQ